MWKQVYRSPWRELGFIPAPRPRAAPPLDLKFGCRAVCRAVGCPQPVMTTHLPCIFVGPWEAPLLAVPGWASWCLFHPPLPLQPHPQRPEPSHVPSSSAPCEQDGQQVHRPGTAGQLHPVSSTLDPPQDPSWWASDPHEHTGSWLCGTHPPQPGPSLHHGQPAAAPCPAQSLGLLLGPGPGRACGSSVEPAGHLPTPQRTPASWGPRLGPEMVTVLGATEKMPCLGQAGTKLAPTALGVYPRASLILFSIEALPVSI